MAEAVPLYQKALSMAGSVDMQDGIRCSLSVLLYSLGRYQASMEAVAPVIEEQRINKKGVLGVRVLVNLALTETIEGQQQKAIDYFGIAMEMVQAYTGQEKW